MLPSTLRLKLPPKWNRNYPDIKTSTNLFKLLAKNVAGSQNPRVGFIISTKVGKAVVRNRLRRRLEILLKPLLSASKEPWEIILIVYPAANGAKNEEISTSLNQALSKIHF